MCQAQDEDWLWRPTHPSSMSREGCRLAGTKLKRKMVGGSPSIDGRRGGVERDEDGGGDSGEDGAA